LYRFVIIYESAEGELLLILYKETLLIFQKDYFFNPLSLFSIRCGVAEGYSFSDNPGGTLLPIKFLYGENLRDDFIRKVPDAASFPSRFRRFYVEDSRKIWRPYWVPTSLPCFLSCGIVLFPEVLQQPLIGDNLRIVI
jgi:hypothetical protein